MNQLTLFLIIWLFHAHSSNAIGPGLARFQPFVQHNPEPIRPADPTAFPYTNEANSYAYWNCHTIPPNMTLCKSVGYSRMVLPNFLQHESLREAIQQANVWVALVNTDCHPDIQRFLCSLYAPVCLKSHQESKIPPCWELCEQVRNACLPRMRLFGFDWPEIVQCHQFPKLAESMCIPPQENTAVKCAPCEQALTLENIASSYCMADVVLKVAIKDIVPAQDTTALRLTLNSKTTVLKLIRRDGTITTNKDIQRLWKRSRLRRHNPVVAKVRQVAPSMRAFTPFDVNRPKADYLSRRPRTLDNHRYGLNANKAVNSLYREKRIRPRNPAASAHDLDGITDLHLGCSACSGLASIASTPDSADHTNKRWLVMGRRIAEGPGNTYTNRVQITFLLAWDRSSPEFRHALNAIRTQPVSKLCPKKNQLPLQPQSPAHDSTLPELSDAPNTRHAPQPRENTPASLVPTRYEQAEKQQPTSSEDEKPDQSNVRQPPQFSYNATPPASGRQHVAQTGVSNTQRFMWHVAAPRQQLSRTPTYQNVIKSWRPDRGPSNPRHNPGWGQPPRMNSEERRRRRRRRERKPEGRKKQTNATDLQQDQQTRVLNPRTTTTTTNTGHEQSSMRKEPINPYSNEDTNEYSRAFWFP